MNSGKSGSSKNGSIDVTEGFKYVGSGTDTVNGKTLPYDEYSADNNTTLRFFMDGAKLYAITSKAGDTQTEMVILELTANIPAEMISIPTDYNESTAMAVPGNIDTSETEQTDTDDE